MKKIIKTLIFCVIISIVVFVVICRLISQNYEYSIGRDTHKNFWKQRISNSNLYIDEWRIKYCLYNFKYNETVINDLNSYKSYGKYIYFCGDDGLVYIRLDIHNNKILYYQAIGCNLTNVEEMKKRVTLKLLLLTKQFLKKIDRDLTNY